MRNALANLTGIAAIHGPGEECEEVRQSMKILNIVRQ
jgi:hypothetical protein